MVDDLKQGLPVFGYKPQSANAVDAVNLNKLLEEGLLRRIDELVASDLDVDRRWVAVAKTHLEQGFMALNRAVFKPARMDVPDDIPPTIGEFLASLLSKPCAR